MLYGKCLPKFVLICAIAMHQISAFRSDDTVHLVYSTKNQRVHRTIPSQYPIRFSDNLRLRRQSGYNYDRPSISFDLPTKKPEKPTGNQGGYPKVPAPPKPDTFSPPTPQGGFSYSPAPADLGYPKIDIPQSPISFPGVNTQGNAPPSGYPRENPNFQTPSPTNFGISNNPQTTPNPVAPSSKYVPSIVEVQAINPSSLATAKPTIVYGPPSPGPNTVDQVNIVLPPGPRSEYGAPQGTPSSTAGPPYLPPKESPPSSYQPNDVSMIIIVPDIPQSLDTSTSGPEYLPPLGQKPDVALPPSPSPTPSAPKYESPPATPSKEYLKPSIPNVSPSNKPIPEVSPTVSVPASTYLPPYQ